MLTTDHTSESGEIYTIFLSRNAGKAKQTGKKPQIYCNKTKKLTNKLSFVLQMSVKLNKTIQVKTLLFTSLVVVVDSQTEMKKTRNNSDSEFNFCSITYLYGDKQKEKSCA